MRPADAGAASVIETLKLSKRYAGGFRSGGTLAVDEVTFSVQPGQVFGFLVNFHLAVADNPERALRLHPELREERIQAQQHHVL